MKDRVSQFLSLLKTTAIGGIFFLFPLIIVGALIGQTVQVVWGVANAVHGYLPIASAAGYALVLVLILVVLLMLCFAGGVAAKRSLGRRFTESVEKYLLMLFPRYAIFKEQLTGNIGGEVLHNQLKPVMVSMPDGQRLAMEVERGLIDDANRVTIFLPGSPDPWSGSVVIVESFRVKSLKVPYSEAMATVEQLGRGSLRLFAARATDLPLPP